MKGFKSLIACLGIFVTICVGFLLFADKFGYEIKIMRTADEINVLDDSGAYKLVEMRPRPALFGIYLEVSQ